jgi:ubiquinone/menaquinone biosynthesis C-methylase UbiE
MNLLLRFLRWFSKHLYTTVAWSYDGIAWLVSMGQWGAWQRVGLERIPQGRILEIGHGPGHVLEMLAESGASAIGLDLSRQMGRLAAHRLRRKGRVVNLVRARAQAVPLVSGRFDAVLSTFPSEYILDPETSAEIWRLLRPGGVLVIIPGATITGRSLPDRLGAWFNHAAFQSAGPDPFWIHPLEAVGFVTTVDQVRLDRAVVVRTMALKPASSPSIAPGPSRA